MLYDSILSQSQKIRFHTPGHGELPADLLKVDVTELPYSDNLASPRGELKTLENFLASAYGAEAAFLSTQGATHNLHQAVYARKDDGAFLLVGKTHLSIYNALRMFGCDAYHVDKLTENDEIPADVRTVVFTCPDYFGDASDVEKTCRALREKGYVNIVDAAHGAHFAFSSKLPSSAPEYADLAVLSLHKTLPVLTGGSVLCCKKEYAERARFCRNLLHTTSPNYMTMCSIELAVKRFLSEGEKIYDDIFSAVGSFASALRAPFTPEKTDDFSRLVVSSPYDGAAVADALFTRGFVVETSFENKVVLIVTCNNYYFLPTLCRVLNELPAQKPYVPEKNLFRTHETPTRLRFGQKWETVDLSDAIGRKIFGEVGLYPPGVPLLYDGDEVTAEIASYLSENAEKTFGLENGRARVLQ